MEGSLITGVILIIGYNLLFALSHTVLASNKVKKTVSSALPGIMPYYRAVYNIISFASLAALWYFSPHPDITIYKLHGIYSFAAIFIQGLALMGLGYTFWYVDGSEFLGLKQIIRKIKGEYNFDTLDEESKLMVRGPYRISRHPIYLFSIVFIWARTGMDLFYFITVICFTVYFYIGSLYEEKKLIDKFGESYKIYQAGTGRIFPRLFRSGL